MKLGLWNRLALVAGSLFAIIGGTRMVIKANTDAAISREAGFKLCQEANHRPYMKQPADCYDIWLHDQYGYGWTEWWQSIALFAAVAVIFYLLIALAVFLVKWIWRGRQVNGAYPDPQG